MPERILAASQGLLEEGTSFTELSIGRICQATGISRPTFYAHFRDKRAVLERLAEDVIAAIEAIVTGFWQHPAIAVEDQRAALRAIATVWCSHAAVMRAIAELAAYDPEAERTYRAFIGRLAAMTTDRFAAFQRPDGELKSSPEMLGWVIAWGLERMCNEVGAGLAPDDPRFEAMISAMTEIGWGLVSKLALP
jgi:AcrR family transcriptional regulator